MSLDFHKITIEDKPFFDKYYSVYPQYSGYTSFATLFCWRDMMNCEICVEKDEPFVRINAKGKNAFFLPQTEKDNIKSFIGTADKEGYAYLLLGLSEKQKIIIDGLYPEKFIFRRTRNSDNYIYLREDLASLSGKKLHAKKNHLNKFKKTYTYEYKPLDGSMKNECIEVSKIWLERKSTDEKTDFPACAEALYNMEALSLKGGAIIHEGKIIAFSLGEKLNDEMALIHYEKADTAYEGVFAAINNEFIVNEWGGVKYINREEDLGIEGLRKSKLSYHPYKISETYTAEKNV